jgi:hypothetical protein
MTIAFFRLPLLVMVTDWLCDVRVVVVIGLLPHVPVISWQPLLLALTMRIQVLMVLVMTLYPSCRGKVLMVLKVVMAGMEGCGLQRWTSLAQLLVMLTVLRAQSLFLVRGLSTLISQRIVAAVQVSCKVESGTLSVH